jgi:lipopolysaccharide/colanic/teichoic acid biosynthesis glycosyltransferase
MNRFFDIVFSIFALLLLSPLLIPVVIVLRFSGEGEVFFLQERIGRNGENFKLFKFATMLKDSPNLGTGTVTMKNDPRVLPVGRFLRKSKINELPQLLNILFGNMSVIGPRPLTKQTFSAYSKSCQESIKKVRPGLSGIGSIVFRAEEEIMSGPRGSTNFYQTVIAPYKGQLEQWYVQRTNIFIYFTLIFLTCWVVIRPSSQFVWRIFKDLPVPDKVIAVHVNYPNS